MGLVWLLLIAVGGVIALAVYAAIDTANKQKEVSAAIAALPDFACTAHHVSPTGNEGIALDDARGTVCFVHRTAGRLASHRMSGRDIVSSDVIEETVTMAPARGIRPVVMLGRYGVVLGGSSRKTLGQEKVTRIALKTIVNDAAAPVRTITFLASATEKGGNLHRYACESARQWQVEASLVNCRRTAGIVYLYNIRCTPQVKRLKR